MNMTNEERNVLDQIERFWNEKPSMNDNLSALFYNIMDDLAAYPDAWLFVVFGGRGTGKTYGALKGGYFENIRFVYAKRTKKDVNLICTSMKKNNKFKDIDADVDFSPFKSVNRDCNINVRGIPIDDGIGAFFNCGEDGNPYGRPVGYILAAAGVKDIKGFDLSDCDWFIFDEFVPKIYERISRGEGEEIMDMYETISRDRELRGRPPLKMLCFANADNASCSLTNVLEITDDIAELATQDAGYKYIEERGIFIRKLKNKAFSEAKKKTKIYQAMYNTQWGKMAFENEFSFNDFSNVKKNNLKNCSPYCYFKHKNRTYYIYLKNDTGEFFITESRFTQKTQRYDLAKENDQKRFYYEQVIDLRSACMDNRVSFSSFSIYDLIINYPKFYKI